MSELLNSVLATASDDLIERGQITYRERLASILEHSYLGDFVAVEPESRLYFLGVPQARRWLPLALRC